jgi:hypothetical protein
MANGKVINVNPSENGKVKNTITVDTVLNNYYTAVAGSKAKLEEIQSLVSEGEISFSQTSQQAKIITKHQNPNKFITIISIMGQTIIQGFDGTKPFSNVAALLTEKKSEELSKKQGIFSELYYTKKDATLEGEVDENGKKVYKIVITKGENQKTTAYFDVESGFKVKEEIITNKETVIKEYSEYKDFGGYKLPTRTITIVPKQTTTQIVKKYTINPPLTDADFKL